MTYEDKLYTLDFFSFIQQNMDEYKTVFEAWDAFKREKGR